jgi:hypothetical protein
MAHLTKVKVYDIEDSNIALLGSDVSSSILSDQIHHIDHLFAARETRPRKRRREGTSMENAGQDRRSRGLAYREIPSQALACGTTWVFLRWRLLYRPECKTFILHPSI